MFLIVTVGDIYYISTLSLMSILAVEVHEFFNKVGKLLLCKVLSISPTIFLQGNHTRFSFSLTMLLWSVRHIPDTKSSWISTLNLSWTWCIMYFMYQWRLLIFPLEYLCLCLLHVLAHTFTFFLVSLARILYQIETRKVS